MRYGTSEKYLAENVREADFAVRSSARNLMVQSVNASETLESSQELDGRDYLTIVRQLQESLDDVKFAIRERAIAERVLQNAMNPIE